MLQIDRRYFRYFDWISFGITLVLLSLGLLFVFSATYSHGEPVSFLFKKQVGGVALSLVIYFFFCVTDLRLLSRWGYFGYFIIIAALLYTSVAGMVGLGARRWISLYFFRFQPSELAKLFLPAFIGYYFSEQQLVLRNTALRPPLQEFFFPMGVIVTSFVLIAKQPDLGTALIVVFTSALLFWVLGLDKKWFIGAGLIFMLCAPFAWKLLKPFQQQRILVLLGYGDVRNERYQIEQSKIAIGSGGLTGKGLLKGTQNKLGFVPEDHTDLIFSVVCEEWGFIGALSIIFLFILLFIRVIFITLQMPSLLEQVMSIGLIMHIMLSVTINIGMVIGILPIVGIPLPLFSYGLTHTWVTMASLGMLNNIAIRRFYY